MLQQPRNISPLSRETVCFFMFVDEETHESLSTDGSDQSFFDNGIWRVVVVHKTKWEGNFLLEL